MRIPQDTGALAYYPGHAQRFEATEWSPEYDVWNGFMPLGELRIPLAYFDAVGLGKVTEIVLSLDQTASGAVMLSGVYLER